MKAGMLSILLTLGLSAGTFGGDHEVQQLIDTFEQESFTDRQRPEETKRALIELGGSAVPGLFENLDHTNINVRIWTEASLRQMASFYATNPDSPQSPYRSILQQLKDTNLPIEKRNLAISLLGILQHEGTMEELLPFLKEPGLKLSAIGALGTVGDWTVLSPLLAQGEDSDPHIRRAVVEAVSEIENEKPSGTKNRSVFLQHMLQDSDPSVRSAVISAFYRLQDSSSIPSLLDVMVTDSDEDVQRQARMLIAYFITREE
jgi:hypothetical protein